MSTITRRGFLQRVAALTAAAIIAPATLEENVAEAARIWRGYGPGRWPSVNERLSSIEHTGWYPPRPGETNDLLTSILARADYSRPIALHEQDGPYFSGEWNSREPIAHHAIIGWASAEALREYERPVTEQLKQIRLNAGRTYEIQAMMGNPRLNL